MLTYGALYLVNGLHVGGQDQGQVAVLCHQLYKPVAATQHLAQDLEDLPWATGSGGMGEHLDNRAYHRHALK